MISVESYIRLLNPWLETRWLRWLRHPMSLAFAFSLAFHLALFSGIEVGNRLGLWQASLWPAAKTHSSLANKLTPAEAKLREQMLQAKEQEQLLFVDVNPALASLEPPKETKYYSAKNSRAANPDVRIDTPVPKVDGTQTKVPKTTPNMPALKPEPLQPTVSAPSPPPKPTPMEPEAAPKPEVPAPQPKPQGGLNPGDQEMAKPTELSKPGESPLAFSVGDSQPTRPERPRTLAAARRQNPNLPGDPMKQEGGVRRLALESTMDVKATPFGDYDAKFIYAVRTRWYQLIDEYRGSFAIGKVVLVFRLDHMGRITAMQAQESTVGESLALICQKAVLDPSPYDPWPSDLRRMVNRDFRDVQFTFYYD